MIPKARSRSAPALRAESTACPGVTSIKPQPVVSHAPTFFAVLLFALSAWQANHAVCPGCDVSDIALSLPDGTAIHGRLYLPVPPRTITTRGEDDERAALRGLPAVIVCPGYLANLALMEIPWAADLTRLGTAVLFLDRRGQGRSGGALWPSPTKSQKLDDLDPDVATAIAYLRSRQPLVDSSRIAILGHSDGATAGLTAASADWDVRATVAVSASVAPWQFVNHVVPQDLLLIYGSEDHFVLNDTDNLLIAHATRDYLAGPGQFGNLVDGSARRLVRVPGRGHLDVLYSEAAHREILEWLRRSLQTDGDIVLSGSRLKWVWSGVAAILLAPLFPLTPPRRTMLRRYATRLACTPGSSSPRWQRPSLAAGALRVEVPQAAPVRFIGRALALALVWAAGLLVSPWLARHGQAWVPAEEGAVFAALLLGPTGSLTAAAAFSLVGRRLFPVRLTRSPVAAQYAAPPSARSTRVNQIIRFAGRGLIFAALVYAALHVLLLHHYEVQLNAPRLVLLGLFTGLALPAFSALELWLRWVAGHRSSRAAGCMVLLAALTALLSSRLFERMSMAPGYLLAGVLVMAAARRLVEDSLYTVRSAVFGGLTIGWLAAVVCALY